MIIINSIKIMILEGIESGRNATSLSTITAILMVVPAKKYTSRSTSREPRLMASPYFTWCEI
jgi:hypothetical protein